MNITNIFTKSRKLCDATTTDYTDANLLIDTNNNIEKLVSIIHSVCPNFDDSNLGNIAEGFFALSEGVSKYTITDAFLNILGIKVKDVNGYFQIVKPLSQEETTEVLETYEAESGLPETYRLLGRSLFFQPAPTATAVTLTDTSSGSETGGAKFSYTRTSYQITSGDVSTGILVPGIASPWHVTICKMNALDFCSIYKENRVPLLQAQINEEIYGKNGLVKFYANRQKDVAQIMTMARSNRHI